MARTLRMAAFSDGLPLVVSHIRDHAPTSLHKHDFTELVIVLAGSGEHFNHAAGYRVIAGDAFVVTPAQVHGYRNTDGLDLVNILFDPERLGLPLQEARKLPGYHAFFALEPRYRKKHGFRSILHLTLQELAAVSGMVAEMETELRRRTSGYEFMAETLLLQIIGRLSRAYQGMRAGEPRELIRLGTVLSHMENHYAERLRLADLAGMAHLSQSSLQRSFRAIMGHSPMDYLIRLRLLRASDLLREGELNVTETAFQVGFSDSNYFSRQFRRVMACSPREFARRVRITG